jgi:hypothetical protein
MWNTSLLLPGLLLGPITVAFGPVLTVNLLSTLALCLSAWTATVAFRRYVRSGPAAVIGGLVYGFSPYMLAQDRAHLQLSLAFLPPLLFLAVDNVLVGQRRSALLSGGVLGALAAAQLLIGEEVFALWAIMAGVQVLVMALLFPRQVAGKVRYAAIAFGAAGVAFVAIAGYPVWFQLVGPAARQRRHPGRHQLRHRPVELRHPPTKVQALAPASARRLAAQFTGNFAETNGDLGIPLILIVTFTVARWVWSRPVVRVASPLALISIVLSLATTSTSRGGSPASGCRGARSRTCRSSRAPCRAASCCSACSSARCCSPSSSSRRCAGPGLSGCQPRCWWSGPWSRSRRGWRSRPASWRSLRSSPVRRWPACPTAASCWSRRSPGRGRPGR